MRLGYFTMPVHPMHRNWVETLKEDREAFILADRLGYSEGYCGEHLTDAAENIPNIMMFIATLLGVGGAKIAPSRWKSIAAVAHETGKTEAELVTLWASARPRWGRRAGRAPEPGQRRTAQGVRFRARRHDARGRLQVRPVGRCGVVPEAARVSPGQPQVSSSLSSRRVATHSPTAPITTR